MIDLILHTRSFGPKLCSMFMCLFVLPQRPTNPNPNPVRKNHACETCGKAFRDVYHLNRHRLSHSDEKPFSCPICQQRFKRKDRMSHHVRSHQGGVEKPYICPHCGKAFSRWCCGVTLFLDMQLKHTFFLSILICSVYLFKGLTTSTVMSDRSTPQSGPLNAPYVSLFFFFFNFRCLLHF